MMISIKTEYIIVCSFLLSVSVITHAFYLKKQFYPSLVYLTKSSSSLAVLYMQAFMFVIMFGKIIQKIFFGSLRAIEIEHLYDRLWFSITETCLAFTVFRDDFSPSFVALFTMLLFLKAFHWLLEDRVDYMEQSPLLGTIFHFRVMSLSALLFSVDYYYTVSAYTHTITRGATPQVVFGFEYAILFVAAVSILMKYTLHSIEISSGDQWDNKGVVMLYSDLVLNFARVILYMLFTLVMMKIHTFPLFSIRPMFMTMKAFRKSCVDVVESRRAIQNLNSLYPDMTAEELQHVRDNTCIICREDMQAQQSIKRLPCLHIFHKHCLRSWFQRQQTCPICRDTVLRENNPRPEDNQPPLFRPTHQDTQRSSTDARSTAPSAPTSTDFRTFSSPSSQSSSVNSIPILTPNLFPMVLPPYAFPPPPLPPLDFVGLSEDTIRRMEQEELTHVQTRLECLRNVRNLLDGSVRQMEEYMNVVVRRTVPSSRAD